MEYTLCISNIPLEYTHERKEPTNSQKNITIVETVKWWFKITQYNEKLLKSQT